MLFGVLVEHQEAQLSFCPTFKLCQGAIGEIVVVIPVGMAARIRTDTALVGSQLPGGYQRRDDVYTSPGYEGAEDRVDLEVDLAIGSVVIRHLGGR